MDNGRQQYDPVALIRQFRERRSGGGAGGGLAATASLLRRLLGVATAPADSSENAPRNVPGTSDTGEEKQMMQQQQAATNALFVDWLIHVGAATRDWKTPVTGERAGLWSLNREGGIEVALGISLARRYDRGWPAQDKQACSVRRLAASYSCSAPLPADPVHPRAVGYVLARSS